MVLDKGSFEEWDREITTVNPLNFPNYIEKIEKAKKITGLDEAVITGKGKIKGKDIAIGVMSADFIMGSMGSVVGERITRLFEKATEEKLPVVMFCCSQCLLCKWQKRARQLKDMMKQDFYMFQY